MNPFFTSLNYCSDWKERIHIISGLSTLYRLKLAIHLNKNKIPWFTWAEPSFPGFRWYVSYPIKLLQSKIINKSRGGALAIGENAIKDFINKGVKSNKIHLLPYSFLQNVVVPFKSGENKNEIAIKFLFVGKLSRRKGTDILIKAFSKLLKAYQNIELILVGKYDGNTFHRLANKCSFPEKIKFVGPVSHTNIITYYHDCHIFVLPSRFDGWGMVLNEAASMHLPIIASSNCGASKHLINSNGIILPTLSVNDLYIGMKFYLDNTDLINLHGNQSFNEYLKFTPEQNTERLINILEVCIN